MPPETKLTNSLYINKSGSSSTAQRYKKKCKALTFKFDLITLNDTKYLYMNNTNATPAEIVMIICFIGNGENVIIKIKGINIIPNTLFTRKTMKV